MSAESAQKQRRGSGPRRIPDSGLNVVRGSSDSPRAAGRRGSRRQAGGDPALPRAGSPPAASPSRIPGDPALPGFAIAGRIRLASGRASRCRGGLRPHLIAPGAERRDGWGDRPHRRIAAGASGAAGRPRRCPSRGPPARQSGGCRAEAAQWSGRRARPRVRSLPTRTCPPHLPAGARGQAVGEREEASLI